MHINLAKEVYLCFACGAKGTLLQLSNHIGHRLSIATPDEELASLREHLDRLLSPAPTTKYLPESALDRYRTYTPYWYEARGFSQDTIDLFGLGYDTLSDAATIPIRDTRGRLVGVTRRFLDPDADKRYKDPKSFDKANNLYASWLLGSTESDIVVLTEGPLDAIRVWESGYAAVAQYGAVLTSNQKRLLESFGFNRLVLAYDADLAGKRACDHALGKVISPMPGRGDYDKHMDMRRSFMVSRISYRGTGAKDPGAMAPDLLSDVLSRAERIY